MPKTDPTKASKAGRLDLVQLASRGGKFETMKGQDNLGSVLRTVFENGKITKRYTLAEIRERSLVMPK